MSISNTGWECPKCYRINAPFIYTCTCSVYTKEDSACLWDSMPETFPGSGVKVAGLVCTCPKCSWRY